jgi:hypothetical protein
MNTLEWLIRGEEDKKTRLHDARGNLVDFTSISYHMPRAFVGSLLRKTIGYRPLMPWIAYRAIDELDNLIQKDWKILEFGSGMSTVWLAQRCELVRSIEHDRAWYEKVSEIIEEKKIANIIYEYREPDRYTDLSAFEDNYFDFVLIDGLQRSECVKSALPKLKNPGFVYLDNCDKYYVMDGTMEVGEQMLLNAAKEKNGEIKYFTDFAPCQLVANQGLLSKI